MKAKFLPGRDVFGFIEQLAEPTEDAPGFLKASKKVKAEALKEAKERKQQQKTEGKSAHQSEPRKPPLSKSKNTEQLAVEEVEVES